MKYQVVKVLLKSNKVIYRDFLVHPENTLKELHAAILAGFGFEGNQLASFLKEQGDWQAEAEYPLEDLGEPGKTPMEKIQLQSVLSNVDDQLTYIYDYLNEWRFFVEVVDIIEKKEAEKTPKLIKSFGNAPKEDERNLSGDDATKILMNELLGDENFFDEDEDEDDPFNSGDYDSLDDYEEYQ